MPLRSMTGFGRGEAAGKGLKVDVELSSVNRRQLDVHMNMPRGFMAYEALAQEIIKQEVPRGAINGAIKVFVTGELAKDAMVVDEALAEACLARMRKVGKKLGLRDDLGLRALLAMPEVVRCENAAEDTERVWPVAEKALKVALKNMVQMKKTEGVALEKELCKRLESLKAILLSVKALAPEVPERHRKNLLERIAKAGLSLGAADEQVVKEVAMFADRCDVSEEITRLDSHFAQAAGLMASKEPAGRSLDFLCQEMFREINTIGSKANSAEISEQVVKFKALLETVREQVQNVE